MCVVDIQSWITNDSLLLNDYQTEVILIWTRYQLNKLHHNICLRIIGDDGSTLLPVLKFRSRFGGKKSVHIYTYHEGMKECILSFT